MDLLNVSFSAPAAPQYPVAFQQPLPPLKFHQTQPMAPLQQQQLQKPMMNAELFGTGPPLPPARVPDGVSPAAYIDPSTALCQTLIIAAKQDDLIEARWELVAM